MCFTVLVEWAQIIIVCCCYFSFDDCAWCEQCKRKQHKIIKIKGRERERQKKQKLWYNKWILRLQFIIIFYYLTKCLYMCCCWNSYEFHFSLSNIIFLPCMSCHTYIHALRKHDSNSRVMRLIRINISFNFKWNFSSPYPSASKQIRTFCSLKIHRERKNPRTTHNNEMMHVT